MFCRINGTMPSNAEIRDNILTFKGPVTYEVQGTYVCDATNSIGTRSGSVEVSIIGTLKWSLKSFDFMIQDKQREKIVCFICNFIECVCIFSSL